MLKRAGLAALRAEGRVEPNPMVGCVIGIESDRGVEVLGIGHHRVFGGVHAEVDALNHCRARGVPAARVRGATAWVTLEPCGHVGKQPPCTEALIAAGIGRVVCARRDPNPISSGGLERLTAAGVRAEVSGASAFAASVSDPFVRRVTSGMPWVIAKWAQTMDGRIATRTGESQWISGEASRRTVHALRGRVGAILTGIGTVRADDPLLTARGVPIRRTALRVVVDPDLDISTESQLVRTARETPLLVAMCAGAADGELIPARRAALEAAGARVIVVEREGRLMSLRVLLARLASEFSISRVLVEGGAGLLGRLIADDLVDEAIVYTAGKLLGDEQALPPAKGVNAPSLADAKRFALWNVRRRGGDVEMRWRRARG